MDRGTVKQQAPVSASGSIHDAGHRATGSSTRQPLPGRILKLLFDVATRVAPMLKPALQHALIRAGYRVVSTFAKEGTTFLNFGYAAVEPGAAQIALHPVDEPERYCIQLYHRVTSAIDLHGKDVLEVGSGRGGGASFIIRYLGAGTMTGMDLAPKAVAFCRSHHRTEGLTFVQGDAEQIPFPENSFDVVINVESSHCYPSFERFLDEVARVLRPGGYFLFADVRLAEHVARLREQLRHPTFVILEEEEITANVVRALQMDTERRFRFVTGLPRVARTAARNFTGAEGTPTFAALRTGKLQYLRFVAYKRGRV